MSTATEVEQAQAALAAAQARHDAEQAAQVEQDHAAAVEYWTRVHAEVLPGRVQAMQDARAGVSQAVLEGEDATAAYSRYVEAHAAWQATSNLVAGGLVSYVNDLTGEPHADPSERWGRAVYPPGVQPPAHHAPDSFLSMLDAAVEAAHQSHSAATAAELRAGLEADR